MNEGEFRTIKSPSQGVYKEKGSKFLAFAFPVSSESEVKEHLHQLKKKYYDAEHHVYAFKIGTEKSIARCSDDGEPSNSSGPPVLGQIQSYGLTGLLIVVVRYFGGTKLGVPGLINAYRTAAANAILNAEIFTLKETTGLTLRFSYQHLGEVMRIIKDEELEIIYQEMLTDCVLKLKIPKSDFQRISSRLEKIYGVELSEG